MENIFLTLPFIFMALFCFIMGGVYLWANRYLLALINFVFSVPVSMVGIEIYNHAAEIIQSI